MLTVPEAARRVGRGPVTVRRWIREGRLRARKVGPRHVIEEADLRAACPPAQETSDLPPEWRVTFWGGPMPDVVSAVRRSRERMLTVPEAARRAGRDPETIRRWIRDGRLRATKAGARILIDEDDLELWLGPSRIPAPEGWDATATGEPTPDFVAVLHRQRSEH
jgi:excisionase family DNA binding protein